MLLLLVPTSLVSAWNFETDSNSFLGVYNSGSEVTLFQSCSNCTSLDLVSVVFPSGNFSFINASMTVQENFYSYQFNDTSQIGSYKYLVCGVKNSVGVCETISFDISNGGVNTENNWFVFLMILSIGLFAGVLLFIGSTIDAEHTILKVFFYIAGLISGFSAVAIAFTTLNSSVLNTSIIGNATTIYKFVMWVFRIFALYLIGYLSWKGLKWLSEALKR